MFLRSAKNSGFNVPEKSVEAGVQLCYVHSITKKGTITLFHSNPAQRSRAMAGVGTLALVAAGYHDRQEARQAAEFLLKIGWSVLAHLYPRPTVRALLENQSPDSSWPAEKHHYDAQFGNAYTTALVVLTLGTPNQQLPIFPR